MKWNIVADLTSLVGIDNISRKTGNANNMVLQIWKAVSRSSEPGSVGPPQKATPVRRAQADLPLCLGGPFQYDHHAARVLDPAAGRKFLCKKSCRETQRESSTGNKELTARRPSIVSQSP